MPKPKPGAPKPPQKPQAQRPAAGPVARGQTQGPGVGGAPPGGPAPAPAPAAPTRKQQVKDAQRRAGANLQAGMAEDDPRKYMNPRKLYKRSQSDDVNSQWPAGRRLANLQTTKEKLGYGSTRPEITQHIKEDLAAGSPVNLREDQSGTATLKPLDLREQDSGVAYREQNPYDQSLLERNRATDTPIVNELQDYARERLGKGLTTEEEGVLRGRGRDATSAALEAANQDQAAAGAAAGIDPRSGLAGQRALQLERLRQSGFTDTERDITQQDLARKAQTEQMAQNVGQMTGQFREREREYDTGFANQQREQEANAREQGRQYNVNEMGSRDEFAAGLGERGREFDVGQETAQGRWNENALMQLSGQERGEFGDMLDYTESARQAKAAREAARRAARMAQPSGLETAGTIVGSIL